MADIYFETEPTAAYTDSAKRELFCTRLPLPRAARIRSPRNEQHRAERAATEVALRRAAKAAGEEYATLTIAYTDEGKPYIEGRPDLSISFSHTAFLGGVVLAKATGTEAPAVGLDLVAETEAPQNRREIGARYFPAEDKEAYENATEDIKNEVFLRAWCRMEARVKMTGEGIAEGHRTTTPATLREVALQPAGCPRHFVAIALSE